ncbi:unnamed protein product [Linum trigynum]|uniref:Uncharacterized protein n=1 Tax=Linum trigynum TaxID=586398 RepID=A0AAV2FSQ0_9ROSI
MLVEVEEDARLDMADLRVKFWPGEIAISGSRIGRRSGIWGRRKKRRFVQKLEEDLGKRSKHRSASCISFVGKRKFGKNPNFVF